MEPLPQEVRRLLEKGGFVPGGCYSDFSFSTWQQDVIVCYCDN